jgi:ATP-dependent DNA helicase RecG
VVCPLVEDSEKLQAKAAGAEAERLRGAELDGFEVGLLHGQMSSAEKSEAMAAFATGRTQVLVATSVIEVGIDVANASVMLIEGAERFGLSQLHQLRGRWVAGERKSLHPVRDPSPARRRRMGVHDPRRVRLAEVDLTLRGEARSSARASTACRGSRRRAARRCDALAEARREVMAMLRRHGPRRPGAGTAARCRP